ncbi:uncharacterized protein LOC108598861 [Drosophila busckii]|uniref:uncharacterized protein LOC108598861 n=1 Tax=Drosophila busckii TaxID=30019 RepID=UPI001432C544|nr:uncharacterized protein LOC108598861 [Drosophila busckii]
MKRHNAKSLAAAVVIASAAAATADGKKKPEVKQSLNAASALYVDVVKNMSKPDCSPSSTPPAAPKFTILREDFPALPGTHKTFNLRGSHVPDDWTAMISDDEEVDEAVETAELAAAVVAVAVSEEEDEGGQPVSNAEEEDEKVEVEVEPPATSEDSSEDLEQLLDALEELVKQQSSDSSEQDLNNNDSPPVVALVAATSNTTTSNNNNNDSSTSSSSNSNKEKTKSNEFFVPSYYERLTSNNKSHIFGAQFINEGVSQRVSSRLNKAEPATQTAANIGPPPGFDQMRLFARLRTNGMGMPLGGVALDMSPPARPQQSQRKGRCMDGPYGLAGLARNLERAQNNPHLLSQIFGLDAAHLNIDGHCCTNRANKLYPSFAGPLLGGRCNPHEVHYDVPSYYRRPPLQNALPQPQVDQMQNELLFFFFYTYPADMMQMLAAAELAERGWRYHIYERLWLRRQPDNPHYVCCDYKESGEYNYFNMVQWKIQARFFDLLPNQLERTITKAELLEQYGYHPQMG